MHESESHDRTQAGVPGAVAGAVLVTRQTFQCQFGLPLAVLGGGVLLLGLVHWLGRGPGVLAAMLTGTVVTACVAAAINGWRRRNRGLWAKPYGEPSLNKPSQTAAPVPRGLAWIQAVAATLLVVAGTGAVLSGV